MNKIKLKQRNKQGTKKQTGKPKEEGAKADKKWLNKKRYKIPEKSRNN